jgi:T3SS negative regulator,GrlR
VHIDGNFWGRILQEGLYKVEFHTVHGTGTGVVYATAGKLRGGNSAFAFIGSYTDKSDGTHVKVSTQRYNPDPAFRPQFGTDTITLTLRGTEQGDMVDFEGTALQLPGVTFKAVLIRVSD